MKKIYTIFLAVACGTSSVLCTSCMDEIVPNDTMTTETLASSASATEALLWAMPAFLNNYHTYASYENDWGYGSMMHVRDVMTDDMSVQDGGYDWYVYWRNNKNQGGDNAYIKMVWTYYTKFLLTANNLISAVNPESATDTQLGYLAAGYAFRAMIYLDLGRMYEFLPNDGTSATNTSGNNVTNLTVPIVRETTSLEDARKNPRATHAELAAFILEDLDKAEQYMQYFDRTSKTLPDLACVYGLKARLYMWNEDYSNAAIYARKAIDTNLYVPMSESDWLDPTTGFNQLSDDAWMWGSQMTEEDDVVQSYYRNWTSWMSNECVGFTYYGAVPMIGASFYNRIDDTDWRKLAWLAPEGSALEGQNSFCEPDLMAGMPEYASLKFRPNEGNGQDLLVAAASAYPLMRIEEMYFIEAEAKAHSNASEGKQLLVDFMKTYRYPTYICAVSAQDEVIDEIVFQKRIELWGEGLNFFDVKRLNMPVTRSYDGTNFDASTLFNTTTRPAWMNFCISDLEKENNPGIEGYENPNPSDCYTLQTGN